MSEGKILFSVDKRPVYYGNILFHPDKSRTGGKVTAHFEAKGGLVTVVSENGAVPTVEIDELCWNEEAISERYCPMCGKEKETK